MPAVSIAVGRAVPSARPAPTAAHTARPGGRSDAELAVIAQLAVIDRHVRAHEQAHLAAAGPYATGGPTYTYQQGPDGKLYAVGGEVALDASPVSGNPEATIEKEKTVIAAANAPADPSGQDRAVVAAAAVMEALAEQQLTQQQNEQASGAQGRMAAAYGAPSDQSGQILERYF